ncbi:hypothetical protein IFR05_016890, partial [Cadophora sp. M221]
MPSWIYDTPTRVRFKTLVAAGNSQRTAAKILGIPRSVGQYFLDKPDRLAKAALCGTPRKISDKQIEEIVAWFTGHFDRRQMTLQQIREQFNLECCNRTLLRAFERHGYHYHTPDCKPFISKANRLKRWTFALENWDRPK